VPSQNDHPQDLSKPLPPAWRARRASESLFIEWRGLRHHVRRWPAQQAGAPGAGERTVFLLHGWMDVSASFQFVVDCLPAHWTLLAPDWRGFGLTQRSPADCYWFPDYLADLDGLLDALASEGALDLVAHSMGGNVACLYAGIRPARVRRLVNLEGFGMRPTVPTQAPERYREWLDGLRRGATLRDYDSRDAVARRLLQNNPRLDPAKAVWLAQHWALPGEDGRFVLAGDPAHRLPNPVLYRVEEANAIWAQITADVLWVYAEHTGLMQRYIHDPGYEERLQCIRSLRRETVAGAGHMLHHDQPVAVAALIEEFLA
jgi:pimeloyl-ACP methyl ester carboxylesterase